MRSVPFAGSLPFSALVLAVVLPAGGAGLLRAQTEPAPPPTASVPSLADVNPTQHTSRWAKLVEETLVAEKFDDLDRAAEGYRRDKTRLPGGGWVLHRFYEILDAPQLTDRDAVDHLEHLKHWMKARPESMTARIALAQSLHRWAWVARGNGEVNTVSAEGWQLFEQRHNEELAVLEGSRDMKVMDPEWFLEMMGVGVAKGWDEKQMHAIFERGVQFEPEFFYLYENFANYLLPKWYGKLGDSAKFAKDSADRLGGDKGDMLYFQISTVLIKRGDGDFPVKQLDWARIQNGYRVLTTTYGGTKRTQNELAFMAYKYQDSATAKQQFALLGDEWSRDVWRDRKFFDRARDWSSGHTQWP